VKTRCITPVDDGARRCHSAMQVTTDSCLRPSPGPRWAQRRRQWRPGGGASTGYEPGKPAPALVRPAGSR